MLKTQTGCPEQWRMLHTWEHSSCLHPHPTHPPSSIIILGLDRAWLKMVVIFPRLFQAWRAKDKDANELKILTSFQKEKLAMGKEHHHQNYKAFSGLVAFCHNGTGCFLFFCSVSRLSWGEGVAAAWPLWQVRLVTWTQKALEEAEINRMVL